MEITPEQEQINPDPNFILDSLCSSMFEVMIETTFLFQDFIHWIVKSYVKSNSQVLTFDASHVICTINTESVTSFLGLPSPTAEQNVIQFSELSSLAAIKSLTPEKLLQS